MRPRRHQKILPPRRPNKGIDAIRLSRYMIRRRHIEGVHTHSALMKDLGTGAE
jgi:hypothetical protein